MDFKKVKIEIFIPEEYIEKLREELNKIGALGVGNYDNVMAVSDVIGCWRPLNGSKPFNGEINKICFAEECKIEICSDIENVKNVLEVVNRVHPYEEPVINILPLLNDLFPIKADF